MMAQGWPSTQVKLKIQLVHQVALHASFQQKTSPAQQIPKSFITTPLRCSFWPQPHKWFIWVHSSVQPSLNWVCRAPSTKELRATRGRSHFNTVWQHPSSVPLLTRQFCKTLQQAGPEGFREPLWAASWEEVTRLANLQSFSCWNKTKCSLCCFIQGRRAAWKYRFSSPPLWCLLNQIDFIPPLKKKKWRKKFRMESCQLCKMGRAQQFSLPQALGFILQRHLRKNGSTARPLHLGVLHQQGHIPELAPGAPDPTQVLEPFVSDIVHLDFKPNSLRQDQLFSHCYYCLNNMFSACSP